MRKVLLFATALCLASSAMAQTSIETALEAKSGDNTYTVEGTESASIFWKFTADQNYLAKVGSLTNSNNVPNVYIIDKNGNQVQLAGASGKYPVKYYAFQKGETYYFSLQSVGELGFNLDLSEVTEFGAGLTPDNPVKLNLGTTQYFGNPNASSSSYETTSFYATYTAEKNGQLQITAPGYFNGATINGQTYSPEYDQATYNYVVKVGVEAGKTYNITFNIAGGFVATSKVVDVVAGSLDMPYSLNEGENTVPAAMGVYYFTYTPTKAGYLNITSDAVLAGSQVKIYSSKSNITYGEAAAISAAGTYNVRMEVPYTGSTYYIVVDKLQDTQSDDKFNAAMEDYKPGETISSAIELTELPSDQTLPTAKGTYYYALNVPANTNKFVVVKTGNENLTENTSVKFYNRNIGEYGATTMQNGILKTFVGNTYDVSYILKVTSEEDEPLKFNVSYAEVEKGSLATNPLEAIEGDNEITMDGTEYFSYTATKDGKLVVEVDPGATVSFPRGTGLYDGEYTTVNKGTEFYIEAQAGTTYLIKVDNVQKGTSMYLEETAFKAGESRSNPIVMEGDEYTFTKDGAANLWLRYDVTEDGMLDFASTVIYDYTSSRIEIAKNESESFSAMMGNEVVGSETTTVYKGKLTVSKGDKLYIHCLLNGTVTGDKITFTKHEAQPGESLATPIVIEKGQTIAITGATRSTPVWVKASLPAGKTTFRMDGYLNTMLYNSLEDARNDNSTYISPDYVMLPDGSYVYEVTRELSEPGDIYFQFVDQYGAVNFTYKDDTVDGIKGIEGIADGKVSIYTLDGTKVDKVSGNGVYVIKANGATKKIVIRK